MTVDADVIVVGAGPGGASAAYFLKQQGYKVIVIEKEKLPRYKACGGGVPNSVFDFFPFQFDNVVEQHISYATFAYGERQVTLPVERQSLTMVMRDEFDHYILQQSQAEVCEGVAVKAVTQDEDKITVKTNGPTFTSNYLIAADGANSPVARSLGLREGKQLGVALEIEAEVDDEILDSFHERFLIGLGKVNRGYYWVFPKEKHLSVGIGSTVRGEKTLPNLLDEAMQALGVSTENGQRFAHPLPVRTRREQLQVGNVLLVGDAAGLIDPLTGEGIRHAIESAKIAADMIVANTVSDYTALIEKNYADDLEWALRLAGIVYNTQYVSFEWLLRNKKVLPDLLRILSNRMSYQQLLFKLPLYAVNFGNRLPLDDQTI
ncbi:MAG: geranylgeranyl reductase family protein [Chloroflexota bacterium]